MNIDLKDEIGKGRVILGFREVLKGIKSGSFKTIIIARNCPPNMRERIKHYANISGINVEESENTGKQLGISCGKPFNVSVIGVKKR